MKRKFPKEFLQKVAYGQHRIDDQIIEHKRWSVTHRAVFEFEGKLYSTTYDVGATEYQTTDPYEWADDQIECVEVRPVERVVTVYEPVTE